MLNLARGFAQRGLHVDLLLARTGGGVFGSEVAADVRVVDLRAARVSTSLPGVIRYLRRERPAVVLATLDTSNFVALLARRLAGVSTRTVIRQAAIFSTAWRGASRGMSTVAHLLARHFYPWADELVAVSEGVAQDLATVTKLPLSRIRVVPNPVVTPELLALTQELPDHPWLAPGQDPVVLGVGRLGIEKDFGTLIRALAAVRRTRPARLVILGEGEERRALEALIRELALEEHVSMPGFARNPFAYMAKAAAFVLPSLWEGLPGVLIEALACGAPVIATDCGGGSREILRGGQLGRLVPPGDVCALAQAILDTLVEPLRHGAEDAWSRFSQDSAVDAYLRVLQPAAFGASA